jgi:mRNA interferase MazF
VSVRYERGQVVYGDLGPTVGHEQSGIRPVLIVSENRFNASSQTIIAMPLTSQPQRAPYPFAFELGPFLPDGSISWVKPSQVRTLSVDRLSNVIGKVAPEEVERCLDALLRICGRKPRTKPDNDG